MTGPASVTTPPSGAIEPSGQAVPEIDVSDIAAWLLDQWGRCSWPTEAPDAPR